MVIFDIFNHILIYFDNRKSIFRPVSSSSQILGPLRPIFDDFVAIFMMKNLPIMTKKWPEVFTFFSRPEVFTFFCRPEAFTFFFRPDFRAPQGPQAPQGPPGPPRAPQGPPGPPRAPFLIGFHIKNIGNHIKNHITNF